MIYLGIDDTDIAGSRGTNQLARSLVAALAGDYACLRIVRHQLLDDPRVPCTTKNGSASITLEPRGRTKLGELAGRVRDHMLSWYVEGSDPGLCIASNVPAAIVKFGYRAKSEFVSQQDAQEVARRHEVLLEGLGGTCDGVIGALAAIGLAATGDDGRIVQLSQWPDDVSGVTSVDSLSKRGVIVRFHTDGQQVTDALVDVGKHLRPNRRQGENVLFVEKADSGHPRPLVAMKLP